MRIKVSIRVKLLFISVLLFAIPWLGYQYVWELESYLRAGQEQTMVGTARAVATALHERPSLFDNQAAYLADVRPGTDLYAHKIMEPIQLDGRLNDWFDYQHYMLSYEQANLVQEFLPYQRESLHFRHMVGQYQQFLYAMFEVTDNRVVFRHPDSLRVDRNDYLQLAMINPQGEFNRFVVAPYEDGWVNAYLLENDENSIRAITPETRIQGYWRSTEQGYTVELRFPLSMVDSNIAFAIADVDDNRTRQPQYMIGTADPAKQDALGTVLVPSPQIENILKGLRYSNSRVWVVDKHMRVLARSGDILSATGMRPLPETTTQNWLQYIEQRWLLPLYYQVLTKPPANFVDELEGATSLKGNDILQALNGTPASLWRLSPDNKAVILSAAHPIYINEQVMGAVVVEQTTNGIRTVRNRALERLFHVILAVMSLTTLALLLFASRISNRIRALRDQTEAAIDPRGKIIGTVTPSESGDEIGDLSRTFHTVLDKLTQYNAYLEHMASRLSHELRTPVAIVNSSLENLSLNQQDEEDQPFIERAKQGTQRLSRILQSMSEATRLEQAIQHSDKETFDVNDVVKGCVEGYRYAYPSNTFSFVESISNLPLAGAPDLFAQMLDKIISNAVDFSTPESDIRLHLWKKGTSSYLSITNLGTPLPDNSHLHLLDSMVSVRNESQMQEGHLGLGLYIARIIAEYHGCAIGIENLPDHTGVCVTLSIPGH
ncbi:proteobacterial dedicated sortase system histidine kinase [Aestuariibacter salexigens]|uniref:proteobacterial dedicated sortase system histidine kinase n=1 Tax=Aestuariibacter salexigens TaxID=226010 RepID=UPI0003FFDA62|nr:proteobacterial dedicated sortase system histidine kinase [Aestuariibacter salexigens]